MPLFRRVGVWLLPMVLLLLSSPARAVVWSRGDQTVLPAGAVVDDDLYVFSGQDELEIDGEVRGDLVALCSRVVIHGHVDGSVTILAPSLTIDGTVDRSVRAIAWTAEVSGSVHRDLFLAGRSATLWTSARVDRDVAIKAHDVSLAGIVGRNATVHANDCSVDAHVLGDLDVTGESPVRGDQAKVDGKTTLHKTSWAAPERSRGGRVRRMRPWQFFANFVLLVLLAFVLRFLVRGLRLLADVIARAADTLHTRWETSLRMGGALMVTSVVLLVLRSPWLFLIAIPCLFIGLCAALLWLAKTLFGPPGRRNLWLGFGSLIVFAIVLALGIPTLMLGPVVLLACLGFGALALNLLATFERLARRSISGTTSGAIGAGEHGVS